MNIFRPPKDLKYSAMQGTPRPLVSARDNLSSSLTPGGT
jgi:hypothetical protein